MVSTFTVENPVESLFCGYSPVNHQTKNSKCNRGDYFKLHTSNDSYYANFSKFALHSLTNENTSIHSYSYKEWSDNPITIESQSLQVLKYTLKQCGLHVSGNKRDLITRMKKHYMQIQNAIHIQRCFRGFLVRESEKMRGPAYKTRYICNNETDFQTMELLTNLPREVFFSYEDLNGFVYGFNVFSLLTMFKRNRSNFINPYNREDIPFSAIQCIFSLYKKILILYPDFNPLIENIGDFVVNNNITPTSSPLLTAELDDGILIGEEPQIENHHPLSSPTESHTLFPEMIGHNEFCNSLFERISHLIDGDANPQWFLQLNSNDLYRFYHYYYIWWTHSSELSEELKTEICGISDTFIVLNELDEHGTTEYYQSICLSVIESMIYTGVDEYHCKLGAEHVIMILTVVSRHARRIWPELFDRWS